MPKESYQDDIPYHETGNALAALRKRSGQSLKTVVAEKGEGIARSTLVGIEKGASFNFRNFSVIATIYGLTPHQLLDLYGISDPRLLEPGNPSDDPITEIGRRVLSLGAEGQLSVLDYVDYLASREAAVSNPDMNL